MMDHPTPCVLCGAESHCSAAGFGLTGRFCLRCFNRAYGRRRRRSALRPDAPHRCARPVVPCAVCGTAAGRTSTGCTRPIRRLGTLFGLEGWLCATCHERLEHRRQMGRALAPDVPNLRRRAVTLPCAACGTPEGRRSGAGGRGVPYRLRGQPFGLPGAICHDCFVRHNRRRRRAAAAALREANP